MARRAVKTAPLRWHIYPDAAALSTAILSRVLKAATEALESRDEFHIVLSGGSTPRVLYETLGATENDWRGWHLYFTDERCVPVGDPDRNDTMVRLAWLDR